MILEAVRSFLATRDIGPCHLLLALSGGPDSTALLLACLDLRGEGFELTAVHVNHALRGADSDADEEFVRTLCRDVGVSLVVGQGPLPENAVRANGIEAAARAVRYGIFRTVREETGARWIATAHTQDDQAETVLLRLITGSGIPKLQGIRPVSDEAVIRPLLRITRGEVESFLAERGVEPRLDASNRDPRFLRNRLRAEVLPVLRSMNPSIVGTLARTADQAREAAEALGPLLQQNESSWVSQTEESASFDLDSAPAHPWLIRTAILRQIRRLDPGEREISAADLERIADSFAHVRKTTINPRLELARHGGKVVLRRATQKPRR